MWKRWHVDSQSGVRRKVYTRKGKLRVPDKKKTKGAWFVVAGIKLSLVRNACVLNLCSQVLQHGILRIVAISPLSFTNMQEPLKTVFSLITFHELTYTNQDCSTHSRTRRRYSRLSFTNNSEASVFAGESGFGSDNSCCIDCKIEPSV